jgi:hypothetical protein
MNANAPQHPLSKLSAAESALIASIESAAAKLDAVGTSALDAALSRLRDAAHAAARRLSHAGESVASIAGDVLACAFAEAGRIEDALSGDGETGIPVSTFQGYAHRDETEGTVAGVPSGTPATPVLLPSSSPDGREDAAAPEPVNTLIPNEGIDAKGVRPPDTLDRIDGADERGVVQTDTLHEERGAFTPDGPSLFDDAGNEAPDPTEVLVGPNAVEYQARRPVPDADDAPVFPVASPRRKKKGR